MSDFRAIAAATTTLQNLLTAAIRDAVPGASVSTGPPPARSEHELSEGLVNVFLYKIEPNPTWRNEELPYRRSDGTICRRPQLALDLYYLLSFYGDDNKQVPNLLLGAALAALHAEPYPPARYVPQDDGNSDATALGSGMNLAGSGILSQHHPLSFTLLSAEQDEVMQSWTRLLETSYVLSVAYVGRVVLIEPDLTPEPSLPARRSAVTYHGATQPRLEALSPASLAYTNGTEIKLRGASLDAEYVMVTIGEREVEPVARSDRELSVLLPAGTPAGIQAVRVAHGQPRGDGEIRWSMASNPLALVVQPVVKDVGWQPVVDVGGDSASDTVRGILSVRFAPPVSVATDIELVLNASPTPIQPASRRGYVFSGTVDPPSPDRLEVTTAVAPGRYLVRVRIGGIDSLLEVDQDPASATFERYIAPIIDIASPAARR